MTQRHMSMRTTADRIRHTILFEAVMLLIMVPVGMLVLNASAATMGGTALILSLLAMLWNLVFNYLFDHGMLKARGNLNKTSKIRLLHALLFELGLIFVTVPIIAWSLELTLLQAFIADIGFVIFALVYAYFFNIGYDHLFPLPQAIQT